MSENMPTEFIGRGSLDTIGVVIASLDSALKEKMNIPDDIKSIGVLSSRTGASGQLVAADDAVKETNSRLISFDLPRDSKGWGGHGINIVLGSENVSDVRRATEIMLERAEINSGEVHINEAGHLEFAYSARTGQVLSAAFGVPEGKAFGFCAGSPAAIGLVMADKACKAAAITVSKLLTPSIGTSHSNEYILAFYGTASEVKEAVLVAKETGISLLSEMGSELKTPGPQYIK